MPFIFVLSYYLYGFLLTTFVRRVYGIRNSTLYILIFTNWCFITYIISELSFCQVGTGYLHVFHLGQQQLLITQFKGKCNNEISAHMDSKYLGPLIKKLIKSLTKAKPRKHGQSWQFYSWHSITIFECLSGIN